MIGGKFLYHPKLQEFTVRVVDREHPAIKHLPAAFQWEDQCYHLEFMNPSLHALLVKKEHFSNPLLFHTSWGGVIWAMGR